MKIHFGRIRFGFTKKRLHLYGGRPVEELTREELIEAFNLACEAAIATDGKQRWLTDWRSKSEVERLRLDLQRRYSWRQFICFFIDHEWTHFFGNEYTCHRCKKIRTRL